MSWSLRILDGDLVASQGSLAVARNETKLVQDLRCYILEELGTDLYHPDFGSNLEQNEVIGSDYQIARSNIESELKRIVRDYQSRQIARARTDQIVRGRISLEQGEVLVGLQEIKFEQLEDHLKVDMVIQAGDETSFSFSIEL